MSSSIDYWSLFRRDPGLCREEPSGRGGLSLDLWTPDFAGMAYQYNVLRLRTYHSMTEPKAHYSSLPSYGADLTPLKPTSFPTPTKSAR